MSISLTMDGIKGIAGTVYNFYQKATLFQNKNSSIVEVSKVMRVEPLSIIDSSLKANECLPDLQNVLLAMYGGFYVQAIAAVTADSEMRIHDRLEPFSPDINPAGPLLREISRYANESYHETINPFTKEKVPVVISTESTGADVSDTLKELKDAGLPLAVGKIVNITFRKNVTIRSDKSPTGFIEKAMEIQVPVGIRLQGAYLTTTTLTTMLAYGQMDMSAATRSQGIKAGRLHWFKDGFLCSDIYKNYRRNLIKDKSGYFKAMVSRQNKSVIARILYNKPYYGGISSIVCLSANAVRDLEAKVEHKLSNSHKRDVLFDNTGTMIMAIVDEDYRMVRFYFHSVERPLEVTFNELKKTKKDSMNMSDIVQALSMGQLPRL